MRILLVNDDGWDAPGLEALHLAAREFGTIDSVAPLDKRSGCGHQVTLDRPLQFVQYGDHAWHLDGMPTDCVRIAASRLGAFDLVLSGINNGGNLGVDVYHSGTVAAAREAAILQLPAIAISLHRRNINAAADWRRASLMTRAVLAQLIPRAVADQSFWNVNLPESPPPSEAELPAIVECPLDLSLLALDYEHHDQQSIYRGKYSQRPRQPGCDIETCFAGNIAATRISL